MSLRDQLKADVSAAMRSGETLRRDTLRMALSSLALVEKELKRDATDDEVLGVIVKAVKTRKESVDAYTAANRPDLAEGENAEIAILSTYMPEQLSDADVDALVAEAISTTGAASAKEMGKVMGWLGPKTKGRVDGKVLSGKVTAALAARVTRASKWPKGYAMTSAACPVSRSIVRRLSVRRPRTSRRSSPARPRGRARATGPR